jgi:hypothetical protein
VNGDATAAAIADMLVELRRIRDERVEDAELRAARDYLVGVFPIRFETPGAVLGALAGLAVHELPEEELTRYRERIEAVGVADIQDAAQRRIDPGRLAIVLVGDADSVVPQLEAAGIGPVRVERDEGPVELASEAGVEEQLGPVDQDATLPSPVDDSVLEEPLEEPAGGSPDGDT